MLMPGWLLGNIEGGHIWASFGPAYLSASIIGERFYISYASNRHNGSYWRNGSWPFTRIWRSTISKGA
jgi:hypothetical protein